MRIDTGVQPMVQISEVKNDQGQLVLRGTFALSCPLPEQDEWLPQKLEQAIEAAGQEMKRRLFQQAMEHADLELLLAQRQGKDGQGFQRRGRRRYPFQTVFGTVRVRRQRVQHKADGHVVTPSARVWQTPEQMCITGGLRSAVGDAMGEQSVRKTAARVAERAGEAKLLSGAEALKIVHEEGEALQAAQQQRAVRILEADAEAAQRLLPPPEKGVREDEEVWVPAELEAEDVGGSERHLPLGFPGSRVLAEEVSREQRRQVDDGYVVVEPDEVRVHAQPGTGRKALLVYTAVVLTTSQSWYVATGSAGQLVQQVAALLVQLGVAQGRRSLLFLADGASWIRSWFEKLPLSSKAMILCWYHLVKRCEQQLSMACKGRRHRQEVQAEVLGHLWEGRGDEALATLQARRGEMRVGLAVDQLREYLQKRRPYLPNYQARQQAGRWIASNRVEKFNDWSVTQRCKHQGMAWTEKGVTALATLEATRRNGELHRWRETGQLPPWTLPHAA